MAAFLLGYVSKRAGWVAGLWGSRIAQLICLVPLAAARPKDVARIAKAGAVAIGLALATGAADIVGVTAYSAGAEHGQLSIVLAASAVFPLIAVVLSFVFLRERLVTNQYAGIGLVVVGLLLLGLAERKPITLISGDRQVTGRAVRTSQADSTGDVRKSAPLDARRSYVPRQSATRNVIEWLTRSGSPGGAKVTPGLSGVGGPPVTSRSHALMLSTGRRAVPIFLSRVPPQLR